MTAKIKQIDYVDLVNSLLGNLAEREKEVLEKRNSLSENQKHTLEQIGKDFNITRERVRQIEREALRKIKAMDYDKAKLPVKDLESAIVNFLRKYGGVMAESHLKDNLLKAQNEEQEKYLDFVLSFILSNKINRVTNQSNYHVFWVLSDTNVDLVVDITEALKDLIDGHDNPLNLEDLMTKFQDHQHYTHIEEHESEDEAMLESLLRLNKNLDSNILGQWGLNTWTTIKPKRMTDKAYLIMLRENRPLHFAEVADLINQADFDRKKAHPATVHNELILDDKYVLVGRGIYALRDWGYQEGTVADIITKILDEQGPLNKKELAEEVLKQRLVQKTTITLVLMNKDKFKRLEDGRYHIV